MDNVRYELIRDWETPFTTFFKGHCNYAEIWAKIFGISEIEFYEHLIEGTFKNWLKVEV